MQIRKVLCALGLLLVAVAFSTPAADAVVTVKMATLAPEGSSWHRILKETAERWKSLSGGQVVVRLYAGGVAGDDPDVVRKMRLGTLNAGVLTSVGIAEIDESVYALGVPLFFDSYEEIYFVLERMRPQLEAALDAKGFVVLNWADAGWVHFFSQKPVATPHDLKQQKLFAWAGDTDAVELLKAAGFHPVPLPATELSTSLQTGLVNAVGTTPQVAIISQYFTHAKNMTDLQWQLLLGATVISKSVWEKIPGELQGPLRQAAEDAGRQLRDEIRAAGERDIEAMKKRGLKVVPVSPEQRAEWQKLVEGLYPKIRGKIVPAPAFDAALAARGEYRSRGANNR